MNNDQFSDKDPLTQLAQVDAKPNPDTKARHIAAAMEAFKASQAANEAEAIASDEKISPSRQGFLQRLRLTRESNPHGSKSMNTSTPINKHFWKNPAWLSGIAASSIAVLGGLTLMQHLMVDQPQVLQYPISNPAPVEIASTTEQNATGQESVVVGMSDSLIAAADVKRDSSNIVDERKAEDSGKLSEQNIAEALNRSEQLQLAERKMLAKEKREMAGAVAMQAAKPLAAPMSIAPSVSMPPASVSDMAMPVPQQPVDVSNAQPQEYRDRFSDFEENPVIATSENSVSTFSIDVDTAAYSFTRRMLNDGHLPAKDAVRLEEMINYFDYDYPLPKRKSEPFTTNVTVTDSPWKAGNKLVHIGIQGYQLPAGDIPQSNLVFLLDVSGSMDEPNKLPLLKSSMELLLSSLKPNDTVAIVVYAGAAGTVLEPTKVKEKTKILAALNNLQAGGSTAGAEGIALAYQLAEANFNPKGVNRIILGTDGDFNVGQTGDEALQDFVERKREKGIYLSVLGFGQGNYQDAMMQTLAQNGNGTAAYIDTLSEAQKVLVTEATSSLFPIARDVKIQVEFNPDTVAEYRLLGYETRALNREDFANDKVDAGEVGSGQRVTAIYEITPAGSNSGLLENNRYSEKNAKKKSSAENNEYAFVRLRYKLPDESKSQLIEQPVLVKTKHNETLQQEAQFATAVAGFSQLLRGSKYAGDFDYDKVIELAQKNKGVDEYGYRTEFIQLVRKTKIAKAM